MITIFLPCRAGSVRIPDKNTKPFANIEGGLLELKIKQLLKIKSVDKIILSTNDLKVIEIAENISSKIIIDNRPEELALSSTSTDDLIKYIPNIIRKGHVLWTHTTSPFLTNEIYEDAISKYFKNLKLNLNDSLMTVNKIQTFLWDQEGSFNYDRNIEKWPRTQTIKKLYEVNSGIFINSVDNYIRYEDRIGCNPFLMDAEGFSSFDIDWPEDFKLGEMIYKIENNT